MKKPRKKTRPRRPRAPRGRLSRELIAATASHLMDRQGPDAVSMRVLGRALGVEAMSLYRYFPTRDELLAAVQDAVLDEIEIPEPAGDWKRRARAMAMALRRALARHPRLVPLVATRAASGRGALARIEAAVDLLVSAGLAPPDALSAVNILFQYVVGNTLYRFASAPHDRTPSYRDLPAEEFPRLVALGSERGSHDPDEEFELGVDVLLSGLEGRLGERSGARRRGGGLGRPRPGG